MCFFCWDTFGFPRTEFSQIYENEPHSYRIHGGLAVETDYILVVSSVPVVSSSNPSHQDEVSFDAFRLSKTYSSFRMLVQQVKLCCDMQIKQASKTKSSLTDIEKNIIKYGQQIYSMIDTQRTTYLGKVNFTYVKVLAKQRMDIINHVVAILLNQCYPPSVTNAVSSDDPVTTTMTTFSTDVANLIQTFFLTDHLVCEEKIRTVPTTTNDDLATKTNIPTTDNKNNPLLWIGDVVKNAATNVVSTTLGGSAQRDTPSADLTVDTTTTTTEATVTNSNVVPMSQRNRRSITERDLEEETLRQVAGQDAKLVIEDGEGGGGKPSSSTAPHVPNYDQPVPTVRLSSMSTLGKWVDHNPWSFLVLAIIIIIGLQYASKIVIDIDFDIFLLCIFGSFCIGLHTPRPMILGYDDNPANGHLLGRPSSSQQPKKVDRSGRLLLRQSMKNISGIPTTQEQLNVDEASRHMDAIAEVTTTAHVMDDALSPTSTLGSPMAMFPDGAELGSHLNCWSRPDPSIFQVRGPNYLQDKKKIPSSSEYIFPCRGLDLFLTDMCPQNVGHNYSNVLMGGKLRDVPTMIVNFRLPWGILLFYCEIHTKFIPFLEASTLYGTAEYDKLVSTKLQSVLHEMTPGDRTVARWCMNNSDYKNKTLKIVPVVVDGPWVVKSVVGGKPAIIGSKLPINYVYQPSDGPNQALYLEADLDIAASSAARGILSVARSYTQILTLNLGFVIQANEQDELPEQMLTGARLHGIDPLTAPSLPPMQDDITTAAQQLSTAAVSTDEESE